MQNARPLQVRILHGSTASILMFAVNLIGQVTLVPLFLSHWGNDRYGAWLTVSSAVALLLCLDIGHQSYLGALLVSVFTLPLSFAGYWDVYRKYPQFFPWWRDGRLAEGLRNLWRSAPFTTASVLEGLAINGTVLLVSARVDARAVVSLLTQRT